MLTMGRRIRVPKVAGARTRSRWFVSFDDRWIETCVIMIMMRTNTIRYNLLDSGGSYGEH